MSVDRWVRLGVATTGATAMLVAVSYMAVSALYKADLLDPQYRAVLGDALLGDRPNFVTANIHMECMAKGVPLPDAREKADAFIDCAATAFGRVSTLHQEMLERKDNEGQSRVNELVTAMIIASGQIARQVGEEMASAIVTRGMELGKQRYLMMLVPQPRT